MEVTYGPDTYELRPLEDGIERHLTYIIGPPGSGKSTLAEAALAPLGPPEELREEGMTYLRWGEWSREAPNTSGGIVELGQAAGDHGHRGGDRLNKRIVWYLIPWWLRVRPRSLFGEGQRFANVSFLASARALGYRPTLFFLDAPEELVFARLGEREARGVAPKSRSWVRGQSTAARRLAAAEGAIVLDARLPVPVLVRELYRNAPGLRPAADAFLVAAGLGPREAR